MGTGVSGHGGWSGQRGSFSATHHPRPHLPKAVAPRPDEARDYLGSFCKGVGYALESFLSARPSPEGVNDWLPRKQAPLPPPTRPGHGDQGIHC